MRCAIIVVTIAIALLAISVAWLTFGRLNDSQANAEIITLGRHLYVEHCAVCHGENREGQPNWQERLPRGRMPAPPHDETGHTWHHSDDQLFRITREGVSAIVGGNYESDMPGFGNLLTDDEIRAVLDYIKSSWPVRERVYQAQTTERDR
jgi:mono/diheme cytochrome c family protein